MKTGIFNALWYKAIVRLTALLPFLMLGGCAAMAPSQAPSVSKEGTHLFGVTRLSFSPSGSRLASGGFRGDVAIWSVPELRRLKSLKVSHEPVTGLAWLDESHLISTDETGLLTVAVIGEDSSVIHFRAPGRVSALEYSPANRIIYLGHSDGRISAYTYPDFILKATITTGDEVLSLALDGAGERLAVSTEGGHVLLLDQQLEQLKQLERADNDVLSLRFSHNGGSLAGGAWYRVYRWNLQSGSIQSLETEHWGAVIDLDFSPDDHKLVTIGRHTDAALRLVDADSGRVERRLQAHRLCGAAVRYSPDARYVASGSDDESIRLYDLSLPYRPK
jgi:WD40 repeat protein